MKRWDWFRPPKLAPWLAVGICSAVALLGSYGYEAARELERSSELLTQRRTEEAARLVISALTRDMRGASETTLLSSAWEESELDSSHDVTALVANAFARYPYPDVFFAWHNRTPHSPLVFYTRAERPPVWAPTPTDRSYPVRVVSRRGLGDNLLATILSDAAAGRSVSVHEFNIEGRQLQVVALLKYSDRLAQHLDSLRGLVVNLSWARAQYFAPLLHQLGDVAGETAGTTLAIVDDHHQTIAGRSATGAFVSRRPLPLMFFDPSIAPEQAKQLNAASLTILASADRDSAFGIGAYGPTVTFVVVTLGGLALATGLIFTVRAIRASAKLAEMRADFMASVTHELKTPIASIQAMGETLSRGRLRDAKAEHEYAAVVTQQAKRLGRLVDNALAYSRLTDMAEVYAFEPLDLEDLVGASIAHFNPVFSHGYSISVDIPADLPSIYADRAAMELLLDNVIENALRHSGATRISISAEAFGTEVWLEIADRGNGIHRDDLARITEKFVRGRGATGGGTGLGLAIVARIIHDHHGRLTIASSLGEGTTVRVMIPAATIVAQRPHAAAS